METMQNILTRRSVRKFADKPIEPDKLHTILEAAMSGPCAVNAREWAFIVVTDREKLAQMAEANGRVARMLNQAYALIRGRGYVLPEDIAAIFRAAIAHRLMLRQDAKLRGVNADDILGEILRATPVPYKGKR